ncbi:MAG: hypothetical protein ACI8WB_003728 [Phenylobacterium sp.]|jgi:hypothetical protein
MYSQSDVIMAPQSSVNSQSAAIKRVLQQYPDGASIDDITAGAMLNLAKRTLQRRLKNLEQSGQIRIEGKTRDARYHLSRQPDEPATSVVSDNAMVLSAAGKETLKLMRAPLETRKVVGYDRAFLDAYQPNVSHYLTPTDIKKLTGQGQTAMPIQPAGTYVKDILNRLLIDLSWNSSRLEGNTYSLLDTQRLLSFGMAAETKSVIEAQMILNHKEAIEFLVRSIEDIGFNRYTILNLHALLSNDLLADPAASGRLRHIAVGIAHSAYQPLAIPQEIADLFDLILQKATQISNPFEQAFFVMVHLPYLQPFDDVNKRVSRLASNIPFAKNNLSPLSFVDVPDDVYILAMLGVYELNRVDLLKDVFLFAYGRSSARYAAIRQTIGEPDPFRLKHRQMMADIINNILSAPLPQRDAIIAITATASDLPTTSQARFIEMVETELLSLHEGNFARYRVTPTVFKAWQVLWGQVMR